MSAITRDVTDDDFEKTVVERSKEVPVVIDLWAPWCGPCRALAPILTKLAAARPNDFDLVKLNVDENPRVAAMLGARSIPLVVAFRDGKVVSQFVGVKQELHIKRFLDAIIPSPPDKKVSAAERAVVAGDTVAAETLLKEAIDIDRRHQAAHLALASLYVDGSRFDEALAVLKSIPSNGHDNVARLLSEIRTRMGAGDVDSLRTRSARAPDDIDLAIELGRALAASGSGDEALSVLLSAVMKNPSHKEGAARQAMLDLFKLMGADAPQTREYRRQLAKAIF